MDNERLHGTEYSITLYCHVLLNWEWCTNFLQSRKDLVVIWHSGLNIQLPETCQSHHQLSSWLNHAWQFVQKEPNVKSEGMDALHRWAKVWSCSESNWHLLKGYSSCLSHPAKKGRQSYNYIINNASFLRLHHMLSEVNIKLKYPTPGPSDNNNQQLKMLANIKMLFHNYNDSRVQKCFTLGFWRYCSHGAVSQIVPRRMINAYSWLGYRKYELKSNML